MELACAISRMRVKGVEIDREIFAHVTVISDRVFRVSEEYSSCNLGKEQPFFKVSRELFEKLSGRASQANGLQVREKFCVHGRLNVLL